MVKLSVFRARVQAWAKLHRIHALGMLFYTGHELMRTSEVAVIAICVWIGLCELVQVIRGQ